MKASEIYNLLERTFIRPGMTDNWAPYMASISDFICDNFKKRSMGLVCDFTEEITSVYTAVFPSDRVMRAVLEENAGDALLFLHHPSIWDITKAPEVFYQMDRGLLREFRKNRISIFNLHVPLDNYSDYSTSVSLSHALGIEIIEPFAEYCGALAGIIGKTDCTTLTELRRRFSSSVGHTVSLYPYGPEDITGKKLALVAGGGLTETIEEAIEKKAEVFVSGITVKNIHSEEAHSRSEIAGVSILGGTHYSTEKFACIKMADFFAKAGLPARFLEDSPELEDM